MGDGGEGGGEPGGDEMEGVPDVALNEVRRKKLETRTGRKIGGKGVNETGWSTYGGKNNVVNDMNSTVSGLHILLNDASVHVQEDLAKHVHNADALLFTVEGIELEVGLEETAREELFGANFFVADGVVAEDLSGAEGD